MMEMKAKTNRRRSKIIIAVALALALLTLLGVASYAWIRNYVAVDSIDLKTGQMIYKITLYKKSGNNWEGTVLFDTAKVDNKQEDLTVDISNAASKIDVKTGEELFFVIEKDDDSIELDAAVSFDQGTENASQYDYMGQVDFKIKESSSELVVSDGNVDSAIETLAGKSIGIEDKDAKSMNELWTTIQKTATLGEYTDDNEVTHNRKYACVRVAFIEDVENQNPNVTAQTFPIKVNFCVSQKGALPGGTTGKRWDVATITELKEFLDNYNSNDELYITNNITATDDLVFTRPCKITILRSTLTVNGNLIFSYAYDGEFSLNTVSEGHIDIKKNKEASGNFQIDLPNGKIDLSGANNAAAGMADVYVEGDFTVTASMNKDMGAFFKGLRVCYKDEEAKEQLKPLLITGRSRISTTNRTELGKIAARKSAEGYGFSLEIVNRGIINQIDLTDMVQDVTLKSTPCILIDNGGTLTDDTIRLPSWSKKFVHDKKGTEDNLSDDTYSGNTRVIANEGSSEIRAISVEDKWLDGENNIKWPEDSSDLPNFISYREKTVDYGGRNDIEYAVRQIFVDVLEKDADDNPTNVVIHYETPSEEAKSLDPQLGTLSNLKSYVEFYGYDHTKFEEVKIICYGNNVLSGDARTYDSKLEEWVYSEDRYDDDKDDYAFIREMTSLKVLDLSEAVSATKENIEITVGKNQKITETHKTVPAAAFAGMSRLSSVKMSESDTMWEPNIFAETSVDEITFPQALTRLLNTRGTSGEIEGTVIAQDVLTNIKYVYTSITNVEGIWFNASATQYFFTPDTYTYNDIFRKANDSAAWHSKIFMNNGVVRYGRDGEIFLRYDPNAPQDNRVCEFVVYAGSEAWATSYGFDFRSININVNGKDCKYDIVSYDPYALYGKLSKEPNSINITFGDKLELIGEYAFAANSKISSVTFGDKADTRLKGYTFYDNKSLGSVNAPSVTTLDGGYNFSKNEALTAFNMPKLSVVNGDRDISECINLDRVDIGFIKQTEANQSFYSGPSPDYLNKYDTYNYAEFYIHTTQPEVTEEILKEAERDVVVDKDATAEEKANKIYELACKKAIKAQYPFEKALAAKYRYIFVSQHYADYYTSYTGLASIKGKNQLADLKETSVDGINYHYYVDGLYKTDGTYVENGNACLVACLSDKIDKSADESYTLVSSLDGYTVNKIGSAAYHFTNIRAKVINIPDAVEEIGQHAFNAEKAKYKKECGTLDIKNVTIAESGAFLCVDMVKVQGEKLVQVGKDTLSKNKNLVLAYLPNLVNSRVDGGLTTVFFECDNLRIAYTGISGDILYDGLMSRRSSYVRFINIPDGTTGSLSMPNVNTVVNSQFEKPNGMARNYVNAGSDFGKIYLSDYYDYNVIFKVDKNDPGMEVSIFLPGYVFYEEEPGELTLFAVSPDLTLSSEYTTPNVVRIDSADQKNNVAVDNGAGMPVTKIGMYAYCAVSMNTKVTSLKIAPNVESLEYGAFRGGAYLSDTLNNTVLGASVTSLDLTNVESVGDYAFYEGKFENLRADKLAQLGGYAFAKCTKIQKVYLPEFVEATGDNNFSDCTELRDITFGKNAKTLAYDMFKKASKLSKITILNEKACVELKTLGTSISTKLAPNATPNVYVPGGIYQTYLDTYFTGSGTFGGVKKANFYKYGTATEYKDEVNNITAIYYWENVGSDGAYIDFIDFIDVASTADALILPEKLEGRDVVSVSSSAMAALHEQIETLTLPKQMKYFTFTAEALSDSVHTLVIDDSNKFFETVEGVLYSEDGETLYAYPKAKTDKSFEIGIDIKHIFDGAFGGAVKLEKITIKGAVTVNDRVFAGVSLLKEVIFESTTASVFAGWDILSGATGDLRIYVPSSAIDEYKANVLIDYSMLDKFVGQ